MRRGETSKPWLAATLACVAAGVGLLAAILAFPSLPYRDVALALDGALFGFSLSSVIGEYAIYSVNRASTKRAREEAERERVKAKEKLGRAEARTKEAEAREGELRKAVEKLTGDDRALRTKVSELAEPFLSKYANLSRFGFNLMTLYIAGGPLASAAETVNNLLRLAKELGIDDVVSNQLEKDLQTSPRSDAAPGEHAGQVFRDLLERLPYQSDPHCRAALEVGRWLSMATLCATKNDKPGEELRQGLPSELRQIYVDDSVAGLTEKVLRQFEEGALSGPQVLPWLAVVKHLVEERAFKPQATASVQDFVQQAPFSDASRRQEELARCVELVRLYSTVDATLVQQALGGAA